MKKLLSLIVVISLILSLCPHTFAKDGEVIFSSSFEEELNGWTYQAAGSNLCTKITTTCATDGDNSVYIIDEKTDAAYGIKSELVEVSAGETYSVSVDSYIKEGSVRIFVKFFNDKQKQISAKSGGAKPGAWENVVMTFVAPEGAKYINVTLCSIASSTGKGYFDNVKIIKGTVSPRKISNAIIPGSEEKLYSDIPELKEFEAKKDENALLFSDSFEKGIEGWAYHNSNFKDCVIPTDKKAYDGKQSVYITDADSAGAPGIKSPFIEIKAGETYTGVAHFFNNDNNSIKLWIKFYDENKKALATSSVKPKLNDIWEEVACTADAPKGSVYIQLLIAGVGVSLGNTYVDNIRIVTGVYTANEAYSIYVAPKQVSPVTSKIVAPIDNKLFYTPYTDKGDIIGDYSYAGFYGGDYELPVSGNLPVVETLSPSGEDDTERIQSAIDKAERKDGGINIVKLKAGIYNINAGSIKIKSGVLLSGEGQGPTGTILYAYAKSQYSPVRIVGDAPVDSKNKSYILNDYLPAGAKALNVSDEDIKNYKVGDRIAICHNSTEEWSKAIGMVGTINVYGDDTTWAPGKVNMITERIITKISGNEITFDFGIFVPHMRDLSPSYIVKVDDSGKVQNAGVENLRLVSYYNGNPADEDHASVAILINNAKNVFVRGVTAKFFVKSVVSSGKRASNVTVCNTSCIKPVSQIAGARRYSFASSTSAQQILYTGCYSSEGRHDFETSYSVTGPISYVDNLVDSSYTGSETHGTWSTGVLFDNLYHIGNDTDGYIAFPNRGINGTALSQGWTSASAVAWNCLANTILVHKPPLNYQNFSVGQWGMYQDAVSKRMKNKHITSNKGAYRTGESTNHTEANFATNDNTSFVGDGYKEAEYTPVEPRSLYKAQLSQRYTGVISNARPNAPILVFPKPDHEFDDKEIIISGVYQLGAEAVTVYVDNVAYKASLKPKTNEFEYTITLNEGTHKIYVTQTINGVEGNKNADRFIIVGKTGENKDYLNSVYSPDKTRMIINDKRPTYDQVINGIKVKVFGNLLYSDVSPTEINGRVLVPMRAIFEKLGAEILWDEKTATATAVMGDITIKITENSCDAYVNDNPVTLDVPATILNGRFVVPVRFISEAFGCEVSWIDETKTVVITSK